MAFSLVELIAAIAGSGGVGGALSYFASKKKTERNFIENHLTRLEANLENEKIEREKIAADLAAEKKKREKLSSDLGNVRGGLKIVRASVRIQLQRHDYLRQMLHDDSYPAKLVDQMRDDLRDLDARLEEYDPTD